MSGFVTAYNQSVSALHTDLAALSGKVSALRDLGFGLALAGVFRVSGAASVVGVLALGSGLALPASQTTTNSVHSDAQTLPVPTSCAAWWGVSVAGTTYRLPLFSAG